MLNNTINHLQERKSQNQQNNYKHLLINQKILKTQTLLILNQLLQKIENFILSKTTRQAEKVGSNSSLYRDRKKVNFYKRKNVKIKKAHLLLKAMQVKVLNSFNYNRQILSLQLKVNEQNYFLIKRFQIHYNISFSIQEDRK